MAAPRNRGHLLPTASCPGSRAPRVSRPQGRLSTSDQTATELLRKNHTVSLCLLCQEHKPSPQFTWLMPTHPTGPGLRAASPAPQPSPATLLQLQDAPVGSHPSTHHPDCPLSGPCLRERAFSQEGSTKGAWSTLSRPWTRWSAHRKCSIHQTNQRRMGQ